jgi:phosphohistidine phosphatase SixA
VPERTVVSPALRAAQTWRQAVTALDPAPEPAVEKRIYDNTVDDLVAVIEETPEDVRTLAVVGHNPSIGGLAHELDDGRGDPAARQELGRLPGGRGGRVRDRLFRRRRPRQGHPPRLARAGALQRP